jgi:hypothetical protein
MEDAMLQSSSPPPESVLGKRTHREGEPGHGSDTELDEEGSSTTQSQPAPPSIRNVTGLVQQFVSKKKLRPEQRDEVDTFLLVSDLIDVLRCLWMNFGQDTALGRQAKLFVCVLALGNKLDNIRSAAPPYQLSEELKVRIVISSYSATSLNHP